ncbi:aspartic peptidase domain-containing protein [Chlamydoabsidia padenii]|nr:aspartic peptidase domain-containing protein [Chlamydoabsidia padenii]
MLFEMILDTGSADIWIPSVPCDSCGSHSLFDSHQSSTFTALDKKWSLEYLDGSFAEGVIGTDVIRFGNLSHNAQTIGLATSESLSFAGNQYMDGVFGLSFPSLSLTRQKSSIVVDMYKAGEIDEPIVGMYLGRTHDGGHGEAIFGGVNSDHYTGELTYLQVTEQTYWQVDFDGIDIDGLIYKSPYTTQAMIDTGTTLALLPSALAEAIHQSIPGGQYIEPLGWFFPCDTNTTVTVTFKLGGHDFPIPAKDLIRDRYLAQYPSLCISGLGQSDSGLAIMGETFLRYFYSAYNFEKAVVGFAPSHS